MGGRLLSGCLIAILSFALLAPLPGRSRDLSDDRDFDEQLRHVSNGELQAHAGDLRPVALNLTSAAREAARSLQKESQIAAWLAIDGKPLRQATADLPKDLDLSIIGTSYPYDLLLAYFNHADASPLARDDLRTLCAQGACTTPAKAMQAAAEALVEDARSLDLLARKFKSTPADDVFDTAVRMVRQNSFDLHLEGSRAELRDKWQSVLRPLLSSLPPDAAAPPPPRAPSPISPPGEERVAASVDFPAVSWIVRDGIVGTGTCTGALIAPTAVLTAAHCICDKDTRAACVSNKAARAARYSAFFQAYGFAQVSDFEIADGFKPQSDQQPTAVDDIAVLILKAPVSNIRPFTLAGTGEPTDRVFFFVGFGSHIQFDRAPGTLPGSAIRPSSQPGVKVHAFGKFSPDCSAFPAAAPRSLCARQVSAADGVSGIGDLAATNCVGDSGAPALWSTSGPFGAGTDWNGFRLIGVASASNHAGSECTEDSVGSFVDVRRFLTTLLKNYVSVPSPSAGLAPVLNSRDRFALFDPTFVVLGTQAPKTMPMTIAPSAQQVLISVSHACVTPGCERTTRLIVYEGKSNETKKQVFACQVDAVASVSLFAAPRPGSYSVSLFGSRDVDYQVSAVPFAGTPVAQQLNCANEVSVAAAP